MPLLSCTIILKLTRLTVAWPRTIDGPTSTKSKSMRRLSNTKLVAVVPSCAAAWACCVIRHDMLMAIQRARAADLLQTNKSM